MSGIPKGPWGWFGSKGGIYLATQYGGRQFVMSFDRMGMNGAQPSFPVGGLMVRADELVKFAVGDGKATGFKEGKADESVYRYDIVAIDHPVARAMAVLPDLLAELKRLVAALEPLERSGNWPLDSAGIATLNAARAAIAAAEGAKP